MRSMKDLRRDQSGQAMALFALCAVVLGVGLLYLLSFGELMRNKTRAQATADAAAYSAAVTEARAFNEFAFTNRAMIARFAGMMAVASYQSYFTYYDDTLYETNFVLSQYIYTDVNGFNFQACRRWDQRCVAHSHTGQCTQWQPYCAEWVHSATCRAEEGSSRDAVMAVRYLFDSEHARVHRDLENFEKAFTDYGFQNSTGPGGHFAIAENIRGWQYDLWCDLTGEIRGDPHARRQNCTIGHPLMYNQNLVRDIATRTDPNIVAPAYDGPTVTELQRAVIIDPVWPDVFMEAMMATRYPNWLSERDDTASTNFHGSTKWQALLQQARADLAQFGNFDVTVSNAGTTKPILHEWFNLYSDPNGIPQIHRTGHAWSTDRATNQIGQPYAMAADDHGLLKVTFDFQCDGTNGYQATRRVGVQLYNETDSPIHRHSFHRWGMGLDNQGLAGDQGPTFPMEVGQNLASYPYGYKLVNGAHPWGQFDCDDFWSGNCGLYTGFARFRLASDTDDLLNNQPRTYALLSLPSSFAMPWHLHGGVANVGPSVAVDTRVPTVRAMAAALVYYHPPRADSDDSPWREPPSFFNPFWRAKLQRLDADQARQILFNVPAQSPGDAQSWSEARQVTSSSTISGHQLIH